MLAVGMELPTTRHRPDEVDCFLFSAAIWMPHRIHYDREYTQQVEGHKDIVVHGPLQGAYLGQMVLNWALAMGGRLVRLRYRHRSPVFVGDPLICRGRVADVATEGTAQKATCEIWVEKDGSGERTTIGSAEVVVPVA